MQRRARNPNRLQLRHGQRAAAELAPRRATRAQQLRLGVRRMANHHAIGSTRISGQVAVQTAQRRRDRGTQGHCSGQRPLTVLPQTSTRF